MTVLNANLRAFSSGGIIILHTLYFVVSWIHVFHSYWNGRNAAQKKLNHVYFPPSLWLTDEQGSPGKKKRGKELPYFPLCFHVIIFSISG